ncbi:YALIA101S08e05644g1_1 [Yarrowia lipolytica]|nr:Ribonuclease H1 [Yarrowia lipolytica]SEI35857.1 YALIA101S08e05644g1_1 [Yarrowia lipolytica]VBB88753.1 Conserved hypothetical protein [Yarrowia lipolytica]
MAKKYYAVKAGRKPGIYNSFAECDKQTERFPGAEWKGFDDYDKAQEYMSWIGDAGLSTRMLVQLVQDTTADIHLFKINVAVKTDALEAALKNLEVTQRDLEAAQRDLEAAQNQLQEAELDLRVAQKKIQAANSQKNGGQMFFVCENLIFDQEREAMRSAAQKFLPIESFLSLEEAIGYVEEETDYALVFPPEQRGLHYSNSDGDIINQIFTDGACSRNGQKDAVAGFGLYLGENHKENLSGRVYGSPQTNQRAELTAILHAYCICASKLLDGRLYEIYTDSSYAIDCLTKWHIAWERNGWRNRGGEPVANQDVIKRILTLKAESTNCIGLKKVEAHGSSEGNKQADRLARQGVTAKNLFENIPNWFLNR